MHQAHAGFVLTRDQPEGALGIHRALILKFHVVGFIKAVFQVEDHAPEHLKGLSLGGDNAIPVNAAFQSQQGFIEVLPALPAVWKEGSFKGLCVRGGGVVDASWKAGRLEKLTLHSRVKSAFKLKIPEQVKRVEVDRQQHDIQNGFIHLALDEGEQCEIVMKYKL